MLIGNSIEYWDSIGMKYTLYNCIIDYDYHVQFNMFFCFFFIFMLVVKLLR